MKRRSPSGLTCLRNPGPELEMMDRTNPIQASGSQQASGSPQGSRSSASAAEKATDWWTSHSCSRWKQRRRKLTGVQLETRYSGLTEEDEGDKGQKDETDTSSKNQKLNKQLLDHFRHLAATNQDSNQVDLQFLDEVISDGANPNSSDRFGQPVLHEISRAWSVDVMRFFLNCGSDLRRPDQFGVTALHVAAALDYQDMVQFLLDHKADPEARTHLDQQTPLHYAAKNDAVEAIRLLLRAGATIESTDYKLRTPLQLAANLGRSDAARLLLELGADAGVKDADGQLCITALIGQMSLVAQLALSQFQVKDRITRQQYFYLNLLEPEPHPEPSEEHLQEAVVNEPSSPLQVVVQEGKLDLIMNPVFLKLIQVKWKLYGRLGAWLLLLLNFLFNVSWTTVAISVSVRRDSPDRYVLPQVIRLSHLPVSGLVRTCLFHLPISPVCLTGLSQDWWRVLLVLPALLLTLEEVLRELLDIWRSRRKLRLWRRWAERRLHDDLRCSHPMWPQERRFLLDQNKLIRRTRGSYSRDLWNVCDWMVYCLLTASFSVHLVDVLRPSVHLPTISLRLFSVTVVFLWLRLMKHVRAFRLMGPFIVMLGNIAGNVMRFLFLYTEIFIPYACSFWIIFGGSSSVPSMQSVSGLLYSLYRITLVDEYEYAAMVTVDDVMAPLLCGTFLAASSILCVNLLIALLTDTFQRVHDNSQANAVMQQAVVILQVEDSIPLLRRFYDNRFVSNCCSPLVAACDNDITTLPRYHDETGHITAEIKDTLDRFLVLQRDAETLRGSGVHIGQVQNHVLQNQELQNQELQNQVLQNQDLQNQELQNQEIQNQVQNQDLQNQVLLNQELQNQV
ncbi:uncharacterized protein si:ch73-193i2.2 isoform X2 [Amphiprion ocellaris]|uniref:uncharacterized protein si:ch73-193i2.2 isoform X2 n=1 Tax=Amphiprion ocellaris TaxID=80972 RepID=UPI00241143AD|nr:uncharacterized protein si:ch73-193i2.2 isoform X2 [Amphiprion ocellaris]